ncbi:MAG TPA: transglutaminase domain-containing protein, partial [Myxococcaceae bacterium]|nr:transglutaminase domain-containing protein [Myxococcaceae bacterium]
MMMRAHRLSGILAVAPLAAMLALAPFGCDAGARTRPARAAVVAELSDALKAKRPKDGEWFGLYLLGKKVGYVYVQLELLPGEHLPGSTDKARSINELYFRAEVANRVSERRHREVRIYEAKPNGRLLSLVVEQSGDGGTQTLEATNTAQHLHIVRKRPGLPDEEKDLPPSPETIEAADQPRVALLRNAPQEHLITDGTDLQKYRLTSKVEKGEERLIGGVPVKLQRVVTLSEKENVPAVALLTSQGETVEIEMGGAMRVVAEPEEIAKRLDRVEVFALTRVVLPKPLPEVRRQVPGEVKLVVSGLPESFHQKSARQSYRVLPGGQTEIT